MIQVTRIRIQYLNGDNVIKQGDAPADGLTFSDMKEVGRYRKDLERFYQTEHDAAGGNAKVSILFNYKDI